VYSGPDRRCRNGFVLFYCRLLGQAEAVVAGGYPASHPDHGFGHSVSMAGQLLFGRSDGASAAGSLEYNKYCCGNYPMVWCRSCSLACFTHDSRILFLADPCQSVACVSDIALPVA